MNAAEAMGESESWILNEMSFSKKLCCASAKIWTEAELDGRATSAVTENMMCKQAEEGVQS